MVTALFANSQSNPAPNPTPTPFQGRLETGVEATKRLDRAHARIEQQTYANLYGQGSRESLRFNRQFRKKMVSLYRKPRKTDTKTLEAADKYRHQYAKLLRQKKTGLFKLIPDQGCSGQGKIVNISPKCLKYNFPGAGASYSFRLKTYRIGRLADISFIKNSLVARGVFNGAIFVGLGDTPVEKVSLNTPGLSFLSNYRPVKKAQDAMEAARRFAKGVKKDGHIYGRGVHVKKNKTFAMRSIAYRGEFVRSESGVQYNELNFDKRRDIIVAFRIIDVDEDGSATIVWKILRESKSPKLKVFQKNK